MLGIFRKKKILSLGVIISLLVGTQTKNIEEYISEKIKEFDPVYELNTTRTGKEIEGGFKILVDFDEIKLENGDKLGFFAFSSGNGFMSTVIVLGKIESKEGNKVRYNKNVKVSRENFISNLIKKYPQFNPSLKGVYLSSTSGNILI